MFQIERQILADREDVEEIVQQEVYQFTLSVLKALGLRKEDIEVLPNDILNLTVENKIFLRKILKKYQVSVIDEGQGCGCIDLQTGGVAKRIAEWKNPVIEWQTLPDENKISAKISLTFLSAIEI